VHVLWARRRIAELMAKRGLGEDREQVRGQVLSVALQHHLVSRYTSLVAVDKTPLRNADQPLARKPVPTHLPAGWSQAHVTGMPQTATPALLHTLLGLCILFATGLFAWRKTV
jgi:Ca-activated chloride channel family protein